MDDPSDFQPYLDLASPQKELAGGFVAPINGTDDSSSLSAPDKLQILALEALSPLQQRKKDALELAELIYKIYNENCPALTNQEDGNV